MNPKLKKLLPYLVLILVVISSLVISLVPIFKGIFALTFDQGRDFLWVKNQIDLRQPSLVGPQGSIEGTFFGPLWYWLLAIPYLLFNGSPLALTLFNALIVYGAVFVAAYLFGKVNKKIAYFIIILGISSPALQGVANHAFSQHLLPLLTLLLIYSMTQMLLSRSQKHFVLACLWVSLMFHAEPPVAIFSLPFLILGSAVSFMNKKQFSLKTLLLGSIAFLLPFVPLLLFDLRHGMLQFKAWTDFIFGNSRGLEEIAPLTFWQRILNRPLTLFLAYKGAILLAPNLFMLYLLIPLIELTRKTKLNRFTSKFLQLSLFYTLLILIIFIIYPYEFKLFYLNGIQVLFIIWLAAAFYAVQKKLKNNKYLVMILSFFLILNLNPQAFVASLKNNFARPRRLGSLYTNQIKALDWIYQDAAGQGFKVYIFVPAIYDYNYQYLFFWHGLNHYGYLPAEFSYWPDVTAYVPHKTETLLKLADKIIPATDKIYLIITSGSAEEKSWWRHGLSQINRELIDQYLLPDNTTIEKYQVL
jgi:hypothetical protein